MFDFLGDITLMCEESNEEEINENDDKKSVKCRRAGARHIMRKFASEKALEDNITWHFKEGDCYHCVSFGDVDSLSYFKLILKQQPIKYAILSTWCMAENDVEIMGDWVARGLVGRVDYYVGEIFQGNYKRAYGKALEITKKCNGRVGVFRNHSKVMVILGERFDVVIESSANINTNPRCENTVITVDSNLAEWYKSFFDDIQPFNKDDCKNWEPYIGGVRSEN